MAKNAAFNVTLAVTFASIAVLSAYPASAQSPVSPVCKRLGNQYDYVNKKLAELSADDVGDNSVPRLTLSELKKQNEIMSAQIIIEIMKSKSCSLPPYPPSMAYYSPNAIGCRTEQLKGNRNSPECDWKKWTPLLPDKDQ